MKRLITAVLAAIAAMCRPRYDIALANIAEGTHENGVTRLTDAAMTTRHLLVKGGTDEDHIDICGASDLPMGVCPDEASAAEEYVTVLLPGCAESTRLMVASEAIDAHAEVFTAANGKVQNAPSAAGTYYRVGRALKASSDDGDEIEVDPYPPTEYVIPA